LALSLGNNDVRIYQKTAGKWNLTTTWSDHLSRVLAIDWAPTTNRIVSASADYNAYVWTCEEGKWKPQLVELQRTSRAVCCAKWSPKENKFAVGSSDKNIAICYYEEDQRFWAAEMVKKKPKSTVTCIDWHPNNQLVAVGNCDYRCRIYSAYIDTVDSKLETSSWGKISGAGELLHEFQTESGWIHDVAFSPSGESLAWVSHNSIISVVTASNTSRITMEMTSYLPFRCIIFISENTLVTGGHEFSPLIYKYDEQNGTIQYVRKLVQEANTNRQSVKQIVPYETEGNTISKISSADLFGQIVIWKV
ncbi:unnamed protein product, partial [Didymodactylos carnosus]